MSYTVTIRDIKEITHDVNQYTFDKPGGYEFEPGQATEVAIDKDGWRDEKRPFTFTSLNEDPHLQFTIKIYPEHDGVTEQIGQLEEGDAFIIDDPWGTIQYKGPGVFLAGGAGVTPFIAIFRDLHKHGEINGNRLIFSNKTEKDIILEDEFWEILGDNFLNTLTDVDNSEQYLTEFIDKEFIEQHIEDYDQNFYVCGPPKFVTDISTYLQDLGADTDGIVFEE
jgi:ferredoxin-NADP reductase